MWYDLALDASKESSFLKFHDIKLSILIKITKEYFGKKILAIIIFFIFLDVIIKKIIKKRDLKDGVLPRGGWTDDIVLSIRGPTIRNNTQNQNTLNLKCSLPIVRWRASILLTREQVLRYFKINYFKYTNFLKLY